MLYRYGRPERRRRVTSTYGYDVNGNLISSSTPANAVTQVRSFNYDRAGLLLSETFPEMGISGNGTVTYDQYDSRGHLRHKIDGGNDLTYAFDSAERLGQVSRTPLERSSRAQYGPHIGGDVRWAS